jgi:methylmalonyl-CoA/ethylmalonyl-CoA epimerase
MARLDHVNIAARDADALAEKLADLLGLVPEDECVVEDQGVRVRMLRAGGTKIEITEPLGEETPVGRFLEKRGPGLHHLAFRVDDIEEAIGRFKDAGLRLIDETPRIGAGGHRIAFVHPKSMGGVLVELTEEVSHPEGPEEE